MKILIENDKNGLFWEFEFWQFFDQNHQKWTFLTLYFKENSWNPSAGQIQQQQQHGGTNGFESGASSSSGYVFII